MATVIQAPDSLSLSNNLKSFEITSATDVRFKLLLGELIILDETYTPDSNSKISIQISDVVTSYLSVNVPISNVYIQTESCKTFTYFIDNTSGTFRAVKGGIRNLITSATSLLSANFLTLQPQEKHTYFSQIEWLSYYATQACTVKAKIYYSNNTFSVHEIASIAQNICATINVSAYYIQSLAAGDKKEYYDIYVEISSQRASYVQRYYVQEGQCSQSFCFENSLGGIDTVCVTGARNEVPDSEYNNAFYSSKIESIQGLIKQIVSQNSGLKTATEMLWLYDFMKPNGLKKYIFQNGVKEIVLLSSQITNSSSSDVKFFEFTYRLSDDNVLPLMAEREYDDLIEI